MKALNPTKLDFRLSLSVPVLHLADPAANLAEIQAILRKTPKPEGRPLLHLFPELCLTGKTCGDLFFQQLLIEKSTDCLRALEKTCVEEGLFALVGLPLLLNGALYNAAALLSPEGLLRFSLQSQPAAEGLERWFSPAAECKALQTEWAGRLVPISGDMAFREAAFGDSLLQIVVGSPDHARLNPFAALVLNPSAEPALAPAEMPEPWAKRYSAERGNITASCSAGPWESSTDLVYSGEAYLCQQGQVLAQTEPLSFETQTIYYDLTAKNAPVNASGNKIDTRNINLDYKMLPYLNHLEPQLQFKRILDIQATALARRLVQTRQRKLIFGISGGSDSSHALLVCLHAFRRLGYDPKDIIAVSMPGPGSSAESKARSNQLVSLAGMSYRVIPIEDALRIHLRDIGQPQDQFDTSYENAQARERTQILMNLANREAALMVGTGDMSEIALGWSTYNGDQMSFYNPNAGLPKTMLLRLLVWAGGYLLGEEGLKAAQAVADAAITPELLPLVDGKTSQSTEAILGPYEVHDFFLYYGIYRRLAPRALFAAAADLFAGQYTPKELLSWLQTFYRRFVSQQFKRSASPDGPQLFEFSLSPRGAWVMPSDASADLWLAEVKALQEEEGF